MAASYVQWEGFRGVGPLVLLDSIQQTKAPKPTNLQFSSVSDEDSGKDLVSSLIELGSSSDARHPRRRCVRPQHKQYHGCSYHSSSYCEFVITFDFIVLVITTISIFISIIDITNALFAVYCTSLEVVEMWLLVVVLLLGFGCELLLRLLVPCRSTQQHST